MKKMKKFAALLLAVSMAAGMVACGSSDKKYWEHSQPLQAY